MNARLTSIAAFGFLLATLSLLGLSASGRSEAQQGGADASTAGKRGGLVRLNRKGKIPLSVIPVVKRARNANLLGGRKARSFNDKCPPEAADLGTTCILTNPFPLDREARGRNNYFFATQKCTAIGGYLPSAAELIGAAPDIKLASTIDDSRVTANIDDDPNDGLSDRREMSGTLTTTASGSRAAGSLGVTEGSTGDPRSGQPNPVPQAASPAPETLQYITVFDNKDRGGFAGSKPVNQPENFRCAFNKGNGRFGEF